MRYILYVLIIQIFMGCGESSGILDTSPEETINETVNLKVKIGYDEAILEKDSKRTTKRVKLRDIDKISLSIFDSKKSYLKDEYFNQTSTGSWELSVYNLPTNSNITFVSEAFDSNGSKILSGVTKQKISQSSSNIIIPLTLSKNEMVISVPTIQSIYGGDVSTNANSTITTKSISFSIVNSNSEIVEWELIADTTLKSYGQFKPTSGTLDFIFTNEKNLLLDFNITNKNFKQFSFNKNIIKLKTSAGDTVSEVFSLAEQNNSLVISLAPIIDNISFLRDDDEILVSAIIDSKLLKTERCFNKFDRLLSSDFNLAEKSFEELFRKFYTSVTDEVDVNLTINGLKEDFNSSKDSNLTRFLNYDINVTFDSLLKKFNSKHYDNKHFIVVYNYITDNGFVEMMEYYKDSNKDATVALKNFYRNDKNVSSIIKSYQDNLGKSEFSSLIKYMVYSNESTLLNDYNQTTHHFYNNSNYYFQKFQANTDNEKEDLYILIDSLKNNRFTDFMADFSIPSQTIDLLIQIFFSDTANEFINKNYTAKFPELLTFRIDQDFNTLFQNLKNVYPKTTNTRYFVNLVEDKEFQEYLYYYKNQTSENKDFLRSKYDYDICETVDFSKIYYTWKLNSNPYNISDKPYIENIHTNPIKILNTKGSFDDKIILIAENGDGIQTEYSFYKKIVDWKDENGKQVESGNSSSNNQNSNNNGTNENNGTNNNGNESNNETNSTDKNKDWSFALYSNTNKLDLLYGETKPVKFTVSKDFNYSYDTLKLQNVSTFNLSNILKTNREFEVNVTAKEIEGIGKFAFLIQNESFSKSKDIEINIAKPIKINNLYNNYSVVFGKTLDIEFNLVNPRGDNLQVSISNSSNNYFDVFPNKLTILDVKDKNHTITIRGLAEGQNTIIIQITDTSLVPNYSIEVPVKITVAKSHNQLVAEALSTKEKSIYSCRGASLNKRIYEYTSDIYDQNQTPVYSAENLLSITSENSAYESLPAYSTLLVLYPTNLISDNNLTEIFSAYNYSSNKYIGKIRYSKKLMGQEFYLKYYDNKTDTVICEKHKF